MASTTAADGTMIDFDDHGGSGQPIVLVHGITEQRHAWDPIVEQLTGTHRVVNIDLRGHGQSGSATDYSLIALAGDVTAVIAHLDITMPHLVGHSLGGLVATAVGVLSEAATIINVDQPLQLGALSEQVAVIADDLRDPGTFDATITEMFDEMRGERLDPNEVERLTALQRAKQDVVLGIWNQLLTQPASEVQAEIDAALGAYAVKSTPYLTLFGIDPGPGYDEWISSMIPGATTEMWPDHGHHPHLVDPDRFVQRLLAFWQWRSRRHAP